MVKVKKLLFTKVFIIVLIVVFFNAGFLVYQYRGGGLTGFSVKTLETTINKTLEMPFTTKIFLIVQWSILLFILMFASVRDRLTISERKEIQNIHLHKKSGKNKTDIDSLYDILQKTKKIRISTIAKVFNVKEEIAAEWSKILESSNLAVIDYPGFGQPVLKSKDYEEEEKIKKAMRKEREIKKEEKKKRKESEKNTKNIDFKKLKPIHLNVIKTQKKKELKLIKKEEKRKAKQLKKTKKQQIKQQKRKHKFQLKLFKKLQKREKKNEKKKRKEEKKKSKKIKNIKKKKR